MREDLNLQPKKPILKSAIRALKLVDAGRTTSAKARLSKALAIGLC